MATSFYTYLWLRENGLPYYVGKGSGYRAWERGAHNVRIPNDPARIVVQDHLSEEDAFSAERFFIEYYGRLDLSTGCLRNLTNGGEGPSGTIRSEELRKKISKSKRGKRLPLWHRERISKGQLGKYFSEETRRKISSRLSGKPKSELHRKNISIAQRNRLAKKIDNI